MTVKKYLVELPTKDRSLDELTRLGVFYSGFGVEVDSLDSIAHISEDDIEELIIESEYAQQLMKEEGLSEIDIEEANNNCRVFFNDVLGIDLDDYFIDYLTDYPEPEAESLYNDFQADAAEMCMKAIEQVGGEVDYDNSDYSSMTISIEEENIDKLKEQIEKNMFIVNEEITGNGAISVPFKCQELDNEIIFNEQINFANICREEVQIEEI